MRSVSNNQRGYQRGSAPRPQEHAARTVNKKSVKNLTVFSSLIYAILAHSARRGVKGVLKAAPKAFSQLKSVLGGILPAFAENWTETAALHSLNRGQCWHCWHNLDFLDQGALYTSAPNPPPRSNVNWGCASKHEGLIWTYTQVNTHSLMCSRDNDEPGCSCLVTWPVGLTLYSQTLCILHIHSPYIYNNSENLQNACNSRDGHSNTNLSVLKKTNLECEYLVGRLAQRPLPLLTWWHYSCRDDGISCSTTSQRGSEQMWRSYEHNWLESCLSLTLTLEIDHLAWRSTHGISCDNTYCTISYHILTQPVFRMIYNSINSIS